MQAKHVPSKLHETLLLFDKLAAEVEQYKSEKVLVVGFAEAATAIGAYVANKLGNNAFYVHTTREYCNIEHKIIEFKEEHSHATEQALYCLNFNEISKYIDRIIFIEDEITTGRTILNFLEALKQTECINKNVKVSVVAFINAMSNENMERFNKLNVKLHFLTKVDSSSFSNEISKYTKFNKDIEVTNETKCLKSRFLLIEIGGLMNSRLGVYIDDYFNACVKLSSEVINNINVDITNKSILILGTEEFMYPSLILGQHILKLQKTAKVTTYATTRSPMLTSYEEGYPTYKRYRLKSLYCQNRQTYIYNLEKYDVVIILTDAQNYSDIAINELICALEAEGNKNIIFVKWMC